VSGSSRSPANLAKGDVVIAGAYELPLRDGGGLHPFAMQQMAIKGALDDAGLTIDDVDGFAAAQGDVGEGGQVLHLVEIAEYLGIKPRYFEGTDIGGCSYISHVAHAAAAIRFGYAHTVVVSYAACPRWWPVPAEWDRNYHPTGPGQWEAPYPLSLIGRYALMARRYMHEYGATEEDLAALAVLCRANAALNPDARYRTPLTIDDVMKSRMLSDPLKKLDCCVLTEGAGAVVVTSAERAKDCRKPGIALLGFGEAIHSVMMNQRADIYHTPGRDSGARAFEMAGIRPDEIDVAQLYDAFTITPMLALEELGFCGTGEAPALIRSGHVSPGGRMPINTDGGGLSSNHPGKRGMFILVEAVRQLRGEGPGFQVPDASLAVAHGIGGNMSAAATLVMARC
jgi:acetyl-CoA acetyltransferase